MSAETDAMERIRKSHQMLVELELYNIIGGAEELVASSYDPPPLLFTEGSIRAQRQSKTARSVNATIIDSSGVLTPDTDQPFMDPLSRPVLKVRQGIRYFLPDDPDTPVEYYWNMGTFVLEGCNVQEDDHGAVTLQVSGNTRDVLISANLFEDPFDIMDGPTYDAAIQMIIEDRAAIYAFTPNFDFEVSDTQCPDLTLPASADGWAEAQKLAEADGKELYVNADDVFVLRSIPDPKLMGPVWTFDEGEFQGLLPGKNRNINIENAYNGVICVGSAPWLLYDVRAAAWDDDPFSITYYLGPFGKKAKEIQDAMVANADQALHAAQKELLNVLGVMEDVQFQSLVAPFLREGDVIQVNSPNIRMSTRAMLETIEIPWTPDASMASTIRRLRSA